MTNFHKSDLELVTPAFSEGDLIEATKGDSVIRGRLQKIGSSFVIKGTGWGMAEFAPAGFKVEVVERAAQDVPTVPGWYTPTRESPDGFWNPYYLNEEGEWLEAILSSEVVKPEELDLVLPVARLIPES